MSAKSQARRVQLPCEAGLIDPYALKCLHSALEETTTTLLSNQQLDAAKTNRVLQMRQFEITSGDLQYLVKGALFGSATASTDVPRVREVREDLIKGFLQFWDMDKDTVAGKLQGIQNTLKWKQTFHLRDLLWLLFYLKHQKFEQRLLQDDFEQASFILTKAVLRNFGGLPAHETNNIVQWAFQRIKNALSESCPAITQSEAFRARMGKERSVSRGWGLAFVSCPLSITAGRHLSSGCFARKPRGQDRA